MKPTAYMICFSNLIQKKNVGKKIKDSGMHALKETTKICT